MRLRVDFSNLERAARVMGAEPVSWTLRTDALDPMRELVIRLREGIEVKLDEVEVNPGDLLTYQGQQVLLYIMDQGRAVTRALEQKGEGYKFHVADCKKLKEMRDHGRYERYVVTNRTTGIFHVRGVDLLGQPVEGDAPLFVCRYCLTQLNYKNYRGSGGQRKTSIVREFALAEFYTTYSSYFEALPRFTDEERPVPYGPEWEEISRRYRESRGWRCEECGVDLSEYRHLLHAHHKNGAAHDHSDGNLVALCVDCHSKQAGHQHVWVRRQDRMLINRLRRHGRPTPGPRDRPADEAAWAEVLRLADPACAGLLELCRRGDEWPPPEVGHEFTERGMVRAEVELAWPSKKRAVVLVKDDSAQWLAHQHWKVYTPSEFVETWFGRY